MTDTANTGYEKPILCLDFDGVIHSYKHPWVAATVIPDPPVEGALSFIVEAMKEFDVHIYSSRSGQEGGIEAMQKWMCGHYEECPGVSRDHAEEIVYSSIKWPTTKPAAKITIDDRALTFEGTWPTMDSLKDFRPWNKRPPIATDLTRDRMLQWFEYRHLPIRLQLVSKPFSDMAYHLVETLPANAERTVALRKLLEAKDCAVRAVIAK